MANGKPTPRRRTVEKSGKHASAKKGSTQTTKRIRIIVAACAVVVLAAVGFLAFIEMARPPIDGPGFADNTSAAAQAASASAASASAAASESAEVSDLPAVQSEASSEAAESAESAEPEPPAEASQPAAPASPADGDLSWRDSDFAVDPDRTEWNYDSNGRKVVYLTIDDGPSARTQEVLDILDKYGCKATFFVVGHDPDYYHMIKEAYDRGHTIGLHSLTHDYAYLYSSQGAYFEDLAGIGEIVREQIGYVPCFIRFPGGSSNSISANYTVGIMSALVEEVQARGYQYYDWNVSSGDGSEHTADELVYFATKEAPEYENIVLIIHDSTGKQTTVEALPRIIEYYQARGYTFEAIDRSTIVPHHGTNN